jgi:oligopeptide/dipeptide ABC transporter ATP-binding protein
MTALPPPPESPAGEGTGALLAIAGLRTYFQTGAGVVKAVDGLDLTLQRGQTLGLIGESGCGKSVTARSILRLIGPPGRIVGGSIAFQGRDLLGLSEDEMRQVRRREIALIAQDRATLAASAPAGTTCQQLMAVLARQPALLLADEPTLGVQETGRAQVLALLKELQATVQTAVLLITHDLGVVAALADEVCVLHTGRAVEQGPVAVVLTQPQHPYTIRLLQSPPEPDQPHPRLRVLPGPTPHTVHRPDGCPFAPRCAHALALCREQEPPWREVAGRAHARCWLS